MEPKSIDELNEINSRAFQNFQETKDIPDYPGQPNLGAYINPKKIQEWKDAGPIGIVDAIKTFDLKETPFLGALELLDQKKVREGLNKISEGKAMTDDEARLVSGVIERAAELQIRGINLKGQISKGVSTSMASMAEFAAIQAGIMAVTGGVGLLASAAIQTGTRSFRAALNKNDREINESLKISDKGLVFFSDVQDGGVKELGKELLKFGITNYAEIAGGAVLSAITKPIAGITSKVWGKLPKVVQNVLKASGSKVEALEKLGVGSWGEELFEERFEDLLQVIFDVDDFDGTKADKILRASGITMPMEDWLVEIGVVGIFGGASRAGYYLQKTLTKRGTSKKDIDNIMANTSELEKDDMVLTLKDIEKKEEVVEYNRILKSYQTRLEDIGQSKEEAEANIEIIDRLYGNIAVKSGTSRKNLIDRFGLEIQKGEVKQDIDIIEKYAVEATAVIKEQYKNEIAEDTITREELTKLARDKTIELAKNDGVTISMAEGKVNVYKKEKRAQIEFLDKKAIITLMDTADKSSFVHESYHYFHNMMEALAPTSIAIQKDIDVINEYTKNENTEIKKKEKITRAFENYLRRGVAPTPKLQNVFNKFKEWLGDLYKTAKSLNAPLNKNVIDLFDNLLLPASIKQSELKLSEEIQGERVKLLDQGLTPAEVESELQKRYGERLKEIKQTGTRQKVTKTKEEVYSANIVKQEELNKTFSPKRVINSLSKAGKAVGDLFNSTTLPVLNWLGKIDPKLKNKVERLLFDIGIDNNKFLNVVKPFSKKVAKFGEKNKDDYYTLDLALKNRDISKITKITKKHGIYNEYLDVRELLDTIYEQLAKVGIDIGYLKDYFPRIVDYKKKDDFLTYMSKSDKYSKLMSTLSKDQMYSDLSTDDKVKFINNYLRGYIPQNVITTATIGNIKHERVFDTLDSNLNQFYLPSTQALVSYVGAINKTIKQKKFFGSEITEVSDKRRKLKSKKRQLDNVLNTDASKIKAKQIYKLEVEKKIKELNLDRLKNLLEYKGELRLDDTYNKKVKELVEQARGKNTELTEKDLLEILDVRKKLSKKLKKPKGVLSFIRKTGGIYLDENFKGSDFAKSQPFLFRKNRINKEGVDVSIDAIGERLQEEGFFKERPTVNEVLNLINKEIKGEIAISDKNVQEVAEYKKASDELQNYERESIDFNKIKELKDFLKTRKKRYQNEELDDLDKRISSLTKQLYYTKFMKSDKIKEDRISEVKKEIEGIEEELSEFGSETLDDSIGRLIFELSESGKIDSKDEAYIKRILKALLNPTQMNKFLKGFKDLSYITTLNSVKNSITQLGDISIALAENGIFDVGKAITTKSKITAKDLGIDNIMYELQTSEGIQKFLSTQLELTGLNKIDAFGKNVFLNSALTQAQKKLKANDTKINKELDFIFEGEAGQVKQDILNDNYNANVGFYLYQKLGEVQPISVGQMPLAYLENPNARIFYALKTFAMVQLSYIRKKILSKLATKGERLEGLRNLIKLQTAMILIGVPVDFLKSFWGEEEEFVVTDSLINNIMLFNLIGGRYTTKTVANRGIGTAVKDFFLNMPMFRALDIAQEAIVSKAKGEDKETGFINLVPFGKDYEAIKRKID